MAGTKRKADGREEAQPKRARESKAASSSNLHTESDLNKLTKAELIQLVLDLQKERDDAVVQRDNYPGPKAYDPEELDKLMKQSKEMTRKGIAKQMKWTPSCKTGTARFVYECQVSSEYIYKMVLGIPEAHSKKMFKMPVYEFEHAVGRPVGKVQYDELCITGSDVNVRWQPEESTYKITGTYGKPGSGTHEAGL